MNLTDIMLFGKAIISDGGGGTTGKVIAFDGSREYEIPNPDFPFIRFSDYVPSESELNGAYFIADARNADGLGMRLTVLDAEIEYQEGMFSCKPKDVEDEYRFVFIHKDEGSAFGLPAGTYAHPLCAVEGFKMWLCFE